MLWRAAAEGGALRYSIVMRPLLVASRLPIAVERGKARYTSSQLGLARALRADTDTTWIGSPGDVASLPAGDRLAFEASLRELNAVAVSPTDAGIDRAHGRFSKSVLWPLCHYSLEQVHLGAHSDWKAYSAVNEHFAAAVIGEHHRGDCIWVRDYRLALLPALIRARRPQARIGFFWQPPFPAPDVFRTLPWRTEVLRGLLGADLIGFQTRDHLEHFKTSAMRLLGLEVSRDVIASGDRGVAVGTHPMGIDAAELERLARLPDVAADALRLREQVADRIIVLSVDRLDAADGVQRRIAAIEYLLEHEPTLRDRLHFIQLARPWQEPLEAQREDERRVNEIAARVNGRFGSTTYAPVRLLRQAVTARERVVLYRAASVMLVTPLREGMSRVAKEYVASQVDGDGVLVLSEFAGAAKELREAVQVNPYDIVDLAQGIRAALALGPAERQRRMALLRARVASNDVAHWARKFLSDLYTDPMVRGARAQCQAPNHLEREIERLRQTSRLKLVLSYEGALVPPGRLRRAAAPDAELLGLLRRLARREKTAIHIISGHLRRDLAQWFGTLPVALHAEHGYWSRLTQDGAWIAAEFRASTWKREALAILQELTERTPGSVLEETTSSVVWHHALARPETVEGRLREARERLEAVNLSGSFALLEMPSVLEVRDSRMTKGRVAAYITSEPHFILAAGGDATDEELFAALPPRSATIHVGTGPTTATFRVDSPGFLRGVLERLVAPAEGREPRPRRRREDRRVQRHRSHEEAEE